MTRVLGVIPARLESTRLARKALRLICGHPVIAWVYWRAREAKCLSHLLVATDSEEILDYCKKTGIAATLTSAAHRSGTDRIVEVMAREPADAYVNIQGDEPMVTAGHIELMLGAFSSAPIHRGEAPETQVSTLKVAISAEEARNPNNVKVVTDLKGRALYFSRSPIPYDRDGAGRVQYYKHLGVYAYAASALQKFSHLPPARLEDIEKLEQMRFLENGIPITVVETAQDTVGVDTEDDLKKVEAQFRRTGARLPGT